MSENETAQHGKRIETYAMIGDCETAALVSDDGSVDWLCWPTFSSGACFASLLGAAEHGFWSVAPVDEVIATRRRYLPQTLVLETTYETRCGTAVALDFMPPKGRYSCLLRTVQCTRGHVAMRMDLVLRFDYGRTIPWVTKQGKTLHAIAGPDMVVLHSDVAVRGKDLTTTARFSLRAGQTRRFCLQYASSLGDVPGEPDYEASFQATMDFWLSWIGHSTYRGRYQPVIDRSLITLKALTFKPSGGIVAAPTTSLPEWIGTERNWDYRYCWLRDTAFTLLVLIHAGFEEEAVQWRKWLMRAVAGAPDQVQTVYGICGERELNEWTATWLPGYGNSKPVRIGNKAAGQFQLDVFGEVAAALLRTPLASKDIRVDASALEARFIDHLCRVWDQPDQGIWEVRGEPQHFVHSKVMAWYALDRAILHHKRFDGSGDVKRWAKNRDMLRQEILNKGFNSRLNSFTQAYGSSALDASCLRLLLIGFLPPDDPRMIGTVDAIQRELMKDGLVRRYNTTGGSDGLAGDEGAFLACSFWLASTLHMIGRREEAKEMFERLIALCNDVGLLSEEYDPVAGRMLGNFPQALSHIALIQTAFVLGDLWRPFTPLEARI